MNDPSLTRSEMDAITAEQGAVSAALQAEVERLESLLREREKPLSPAANPPLPEERNGSRRTPKQDKKRNQRREFLRGEPPRPSIRESIGPVKQPDK